MARVRIPLNNFSFGEVNPSLSSRTDNAIYAQSGEKVENFFIRPEGGLKKRAGTWLHDSIPHEGMSSSTSNMDVRLEPFVFSDDEKYIIAFDDGGFTPYRVEPNITDAIDNTFGDSLGISQLERITSDQIFRFNNIGVHGPSSIGHPIGTNPANSYVINTIGVVRFKITLNSTNFFHTSLTDANYASGTTLPIRRGKTILRLSTDNGKPFTPANNVFLFDETYSGTTTTTDVGGTGLDITVITIKSGVNGASTKYNIRYSNNTDITLKFEIDSQEIILNPNQLYEEFNQSSTSWSVTFKEDVEKIIWTSGYGGDSSNPLSIGTLSTTPTPMSVLDNNNDNGLTSSGSALCSLEVFTSSEITSTDYVPCPWTSSTLNQFTYTQRGDFMIICHDTWNPVMIVRTGLNTFEIREFDFDKSLDGNRIFQPYYNFQESSNTLTPSGTTGSVTLTTSQNYFTSAHVGTTLLIGQTEATITAFTNAKNVTASILGTLEFQLDRDALKTAKGSNKVEVTHALHGLQSGSSIVISEAGGVGGIGSGNINGTRTISEVIDDNTYKITAGASATSTEDGGGSPKISGTAATTEWYEQSYSAYRGYPQAVTFHEDRLWFAGTPSQPLGIWASRTGKYFDFDIRDGEADDAIDIEANIGVQAQIRHLVSNRDLQIFASEFEFFIPAFTDQPVTPANAKISSQTPFGIGYTKPLPFDGVTIFAQADGKTIRDFLYSDAEGAYVSNPISLLSSHMTENVYQSCVLKGGLNQSGSYLFLMRSKADSVDYTNTELLVYYQIRGDRRSGWVRWTTNYGYMQSICAVDNRLFVACNRRSDSTKRFVIEEFTNAVNAEHCSSPHMVNDSTAGTYVASKSSAQFPNAGTSKVAMFTSTNILLDEYTLSSGEIDVGDYSVDYSSGYIGFPFTATAKTQSLDALVEGGPLTGRPRRITKVVADLQDTKSVVINGTKMLPKYVNNSPAQGIIAVSERKEFHVRGITKDPKVTITQDKSLPCQVDGIVVEVAF